MLKTSRGLVLSTLKYNDEFIIADVFTQTDGRVSFMVRVPKSSRQRGALRLFQPLTLIEVDWQPRASARLLRPAACVPTVC